MKNGTKINGRGKKNYPHRQTDTKLHNNVYQCICYYYDILGKSDKLFGSNNRDEHKKNMN